MSLIKYQKYIDKSFHRLDNKTIVITGANSGIGFCATVYFAYLGANVVMACRNKQKALDAQKEIYKTVPNAKLDFIEYNQASFSSIDMFAKQLITKYSSIDSIIFNAGIFKPDKKAKTMEDYPLTIGTNYLGAFHLFSKLKSYLNTNHSKAIFVGSVANKDIKTNEIESIITNSKRPLFKQYSNSKYLIMSTAYSLSKNSNIQIAIMQPGVSATNIIRNYQLWFFRLAKWVLSVFTHSPWKACLGMIKLVEENEFKDCLYSGPRGLFHINGYPKYHHLPKKNTKNAGQYYQFYKEYISKGE